MGARAGTELLDPCDVTAVPFLTPGAIELALAGDEAARGEPAMGWWLFCNPPASVMMVCSRACSSSEFKRAFSSASFRAAWLGARVFSSPVTLWR